MKRFINFMCFIAISSFITSCDEIDFDNGPIETEQRTLGSFTKINMDDGIDVVLIKGSSQSIEVSDHRDLIKDISVKVVDDVLYITSDGHDWVNNSESKVTITMDNIIEQIALDGSGDLLLKSDFGNIGKIDIDGSGCIVSQAQTTYESLDISVTGSGDVSLKGNAQKISIKSNGSGDLELYPLACNEAIIKATGSGDVKIDVSDSLDVSLSGSGNIYYTGEPTVTSKVTGSGKLKKK